MVFFCVCVCIVVHSMIGECECPWEIIFTWNLCLFLLLLLLFQTNYVMVLYRGISTSALAHTFDRAIHRNHSHFLCALSLFDSIIFLASRSMFPIAFCHLLSWPSQMEMHFPYTAAHVSFFFTCLFSFNQLPCRTSFTGFSIGKLFCENITNFSLLMLYHPIPIEENCAIIITSDNS